jgi:hypothetical protein
MTTLGISTADLRGHAWNLSIGLTYMAMGAVAGYVMDYVLKHQYFDQLQLRLKLGLIYATPAMIAFFAPAPKLIQLDTTQQVSLGAAGLVLTLFFESQKRDCWAIFVCSVGCILTACRYNLGLSHSAGTGALIMLYHLYLKKEVS